MIDQEIFSKTAIVTTRTTVTVTSLTKDHETTLTIDHILIITTINHVKIQETEKKLSK